MCGVAFREVVGVGVVGAAATRRVLLRNSRNPCRTAVGRFDFEVIDAGVVPGDGDAVDLMAATEVVADSGRSNAGFPLGRKAAVNGIAGGTGACRRRRSVGCRNANRRCRNQRGCAGQANREHRAEREL